MWKNVGKQLQALACVNFWTTAVITIISVICFFIVGGMFENDFIAFLISIPIIAIFLVIEYFASLFMVGFGKIVEANEIGIENHQKEDLTILANQNNQEENQTVSADFLQNLPFSDK